MTVRLLIALSCLIPPVAAQEKSCVAPESDRILGRDMARALPEFGAMPADTVLAVAPLAGARRVFQAEEIGTLAARYSIKMAAPQEACFEWSMQPLDRTRMLEAMTKTLNLPDAHIEVADATLDRVPAGTIEFPRESLGKPASPDQPSPVLWRGSVTYAGSRRFGIWARVRITVPVNVITATDALKVGQPIRAEQLKTVVKQRFPIVTDTLTIQQVAGMLPLRSIAAGAEIRLDNLVRPNEVSRGDAVAIEVRTGRTRLTFSGRAESAGRTGDLIDVRNPESNKIFRARVCAKDRAIVEPDSGREN